GTHPGYHPHHFPAWWLQRSLRRLRLRFRSRRLRAHRHHSDHHPHSDVAWAALTCEAGSRMSRLRLHPEYHRVYRIGWLRAAVLGANDGIVSTASLIVGVSAAAATQNAVLIAGGAGLVGGGMSMDDGR